MQLFYIHKFLERIQKILPLLLGLALILILTSWSAQVVAPSLLIPVSFKLTNDENMHIEIDKIFADGEQIAYYDEIENKLITSNNLNQLSINKLSWTTLDAQARFAESLVLTTAPVCHVGSSNLTLITENNTTTVQRSGCESTHFKIDPTYKNSIIWFATIATFSLFWSIFFVFLNYVLQLRKSMLASNFTLTALHKYIVLVMMALPSIAGIAFFWPGMYCSDAINQWEQIVSGSYSNWHPIIHTLLMYPFVKLELAAGLPIFQAIMLIFLGYKIINCYHQNLRIAGIFIFVCLLFYNPFTWVFINTPWKDVLYSIFIILIGIDLKNVMHQQVKIDAKTTVRQSVILFFVTTLRHNGILPGTIISILYMFTKNKWVKIATISTLFLLLSLKPIYHVLGYQPEPITANYVATHMLYSYSLRYPNEISLKQYIETIVPATGFTPSSTNWLILDRTLDHQKLNNSAFITYKHLFSLFLKNPLGLIRSYLPLTNLATHPFINKLNVNYYVQNDSQLYNHLPNLRFQSQREALYRWYRTQTTQLITFWLLPPTVIVAIILIGCIWFDDTSKSVFFISLPSLINYISVIILMPSQDYRYFLSLYFLTPLILAIITSNLLHQVASWLHLRGAISCHD